MIKARYFVPFSFICIMKKIVFLMLMVTIAVSACKKRETIDQDLIDDEIIRTHIERNNLGVYEKTSTGLYLQVVTPGTGQTPRADSSNITINYVGRLLTGKIFDASPPSAPRSFDLKDLIEGWKEGIPTIKEGGRIRMLVPSRLGYGQGGVDGIPPNSVIYFDIELITVKKIN